MLLTFLFWSGIKLLLMRYSGENKTWFNFLFFSVKSVDLSQDALNVLVFLEDFIFYSGLSRKVCLQQHVNCHVLKFSLQN